MFVLDIHKEFSGQISPEGKKYSLREVAGDQYIIDKGILAFSIEKGGKIYDVHTPILTIETKEIYCYTWEDDEGKMVFWHSSAHVMADAIMRLFPDALLTIGPPVDNGFYYDIDFGENTHVEEKIEDIEREFARIIKENATFTREECSFEDAINYYQKEYPNPYKLEIIEEIKGRGERECSFYRHGRFRDLCSGPHILTPSMIGAFKITGIAGAYWRGNAKNKQLTRIYGITFPTKQELEKYLQMVEEAKNRDHKKLGYDMELFIISNRVGAGLPLWLPAGQTLRNLLIQFIRNAQNKLGYQEVFTPHIGSKNLYVTSGHYEKYGKDSFQPIETPDGHDSYLLKPMNCPHHCEIYGYRTRSYKELPLKISEFGTVYRYEKSGEIHGLVRARSFTQDDAHIFCTEDQLHEVISETLDLIKFVLDTFEFKDRIVRLSLRDPHDNDKYIGSPEVWDNAEKILREVAGNHFPSFVEQQGEAAFYGPKIDFIVRDSLGRKWQVGTLQLDFNLPVRFNLKYNGKDNKVHTPVMIHRALLGSIERFVAILLENTNGNLPIWLAPIQFAILPLGDEVMDFSHEIAEKLTRAGLRFIIHHSSERLSKRIKQMEIRKIPFQLIIGGKERESGVVSVRSRFPAILPDSSSLPIDQIISIVKEHSIIPEYTKYR